MSDYIKQHTTICNFNHDDSWVVLSVIEQQIKEKIERIGTPLKDWNIQINYGIKTGFNDAFIITGEKRKELIEKDPKSAEIIRPIIRGRDIKRYGYDFADLYIIATFPSLKINIEDYPSVEQHLLGFGYDRLKQTGETGSRKKTNNKWFETQDSISYWEDFSKQKIVWKRVGSILRFCFDSEGYYALDSTCFATGKYIKFLVGFLNSKMGNYLLQDSPKTGTGDLLISVQAIEPIKVPHLTEEQEIVFNDLIDNILNETSNEKMNEFEIMLDNIVFELYNLNNDEISKILSKQSE